MVKYSNGRDGGGGGDCGINDGGGKEWWRVGVDEWAEVGAANQRTMRQLFCHKKNHQINCDKF